MSTLDDVTAQAQQQAKDATARAKSAIVDQLQTRSQALGNRTLEHATNLRRIGDSLRDQSEPSTARLADAAAERLEWAGNYFASTDANEIISDAEALARSRPLATVAAGLIAGFAAARMLKAGASNRYRSIDRRRSSRTDSGVD